MTAPATDVTPAAPPAGASLWEDFIDIFYAPTDVYTRRRDGRFGLALVVLMVVSALLLAGFWNVLRPMIEATVELSLRAAAAKGQPMPEAAAATARRIGTTMFAVMGVLMVPIGILCTAFITWLFGKLFDATLSFAQAMAVVTFAQVPRVLGWVVLGVQGLMGDLGKPIYSYLISPSRFLDPETASATLIGALSRVELFTIWATILIGIGVSVIGRVPRAKGYLVAASVWFVASAFTLLQALRG